MNVKVNMIPVKQALAKRGLETGGKTQKYFTLACAREMDPYVPMSAGSSAHMKNLKIIEQDTVVYPGPYARNMYHGKVMVDPKTGAAGFLTANGWRSRKGIRKVVSTRDYKYHGAPKRGAYWDRRMWADKKAKIVRETAAYAGGVGKT